MARSFPISRVVHPADNQAAEWLAQLTQGRVAKVLGRDAADSFTEKDIEKAQEILADYLVYEKNADLDHYDGPLRGDTWTAERIAQLKAALPSLSGYLNHVEKHKNQPYWFSDVLPSAIVHQGLRKCAEDIVEALTPEKRFLNIRALRDANDALNNRPSPYATAEQIPHIRAKLDRFHTITQENVGVLLALFEDGSGHEKILGLGRMLISGESYDQVYKLPFQGGEPSDEFPLNIENLPRATTQQAKALKDALHEAVASYEVSLEKSGYDRAYILGDNGTLYLAIKEHGKVKSFTTNDLVSLPYEKNDRTKGYVVRSVDVINSVAEATVGFWGKTLKSFYATLRSVFIGRLDGAMKTSADAAADAALGKAAEKDETSAVKKVVVGTGFATATGGLLAYSAPVALFLGAIGVSVTGFNLFDMYSTGHDRRSILNAIGVIINTKDKIH